MPFSEKEMLEDLRGVRIRKYVYFLGGLGILGLSVALVVVFISRRDLPALLLAGVGAFWCGVLLHQARRARSLEGLIGARLAKGGVSSAGDHSGRDPGEGADAAPSPDRGENAAAAGAAEPGDAADAEGGGPG